MTREHWGSRLGFVLATAGSAVGLGNIWRFPYTTGENGGGAFLLIYLAIVLLFGLSLAMAEILIGRAAQRNPVGAFRQLSGPAWMPVGGMGVIAGFFILSFYVVVAGWTLAYIAYMASGTLAHTDPAILGAHFESFISSPVKTIGFAGLFMGVTAFVVSGGVAAGIERANKILMPTLFLLLIILVVRAVTLPNAAEGLKFFLIPDFSKVSAETFGAALAQAFFSLSLGMGCLLTYGSYLSRQTRLPGTTMTVVGLDLCVSLLAGMIVLPVVFAFGFDPAAGPGLTFVTLPAIFASMPAGAAFGVLFFILLSIAALTSAISILEPAVSFLIDELKFSRTKAVTIAASICFALAIPSALSFGVMADFKIAGRNFFDLMDFLATSVMLPLGALFMSLFVGWRWAQGARQEMLLADGSEPAWLDAWIFMLRFLAPSGLAWILITSFVA